MSTIQNLVQSEANLIATIRTTTRALDQLGRGELDVAMLHLQETALQAKGRLQAASLAMRNILGDVFDHAEDLGASLALGLPAPVIVQVIEAPVPVPDPAKQEGEVQTETPSRIEPAGQEAGAEAQPKNRKKKR